MLSLLNMLVIKMRNYYQLLVCEPSFSKSDYKSSWPWNMAKNGKQCSVVSFVKVKFHMSLSTTTWSIFHICVIQL